MAAFLPYSTFSQNADAPLSGAVPAVDSALPDAAVADAPAQGPGTPASRAQEEALFSFDDSAPEGAAVPRSPSSFLAILRMVLVLALVAGLIYLVVYFLRRMGKPQVEQNPHLKILASTHLGSGRYVHVVSVGKEAWLIGSGEGGVNHIAAIGDGEAIDAMVLDASKKKAEAPEPFNFQSMLKKFSGGLSAKEKDRLETMRARREKFKRF